MCLAEFVAFNTFSKKRSSKVQKENGENFDSGPHSWEENFDNKWIALLNKSGLFKSAQKLA